MTREPERPDRGPAAPDATAGSSSGRTRMRGPLGRLAARGRDATPALGGAPGRWLPLAWLGLLLLVLIRTAWMSDDAYITLRTVDNFVHGHGLRWNVDERVQAYTHPLWMFLEAALYFVTREAFHSMILLSIAISMVAAGLLAFRSRARAGAFALGALALICSRSFVDYSTSGLENPLTHLLAVVFLLHLREEIPDRRGLLLLGAVSGLAALNRIDSLLLFLPGLAYAWGRFGWRKGLPVVLTGFVPLLAWEFFSLFYYGLPVPNTALAKLNTGIDGMSLARQGTWYLANSLRTDPVTLPVIAAGLAAAFAGRRRRDAAVALGIVLSIVYVVKIGGDFMSGRFLSAPLLAAVVLLIRVETFPVRFGRPALAAAILGLAIATPHPSITSGPGFGVLNAGRVDARGIADERRFYFSVAGWRNGEASSERPVHRSTRTGREARRMRSPILVAGAIGVVGFYAGPEVHIVDYHALADPLLSRLPIVSKDQMYEGFMIGSTGKIGTGPWRIGHFLRNIPPGYLETVLTGENRIEEPRLAAFYDRLAVVTRGPLWSAKRIGEIVRMNLGRDNALIDRTHPPAFDAIRWDEVIAARPDAPVGYLERAGSRFDAGDTQGAMEDAQQAIRLDPRNAEAQLLIGRIERDRGNFEAALRAFSTARDAEPDLAAAYAHLGDIHLRLGDQARGIESFKQALEIDPELSLASANIAVAYAQTGNLEAAAAWIAKAYAISPDNPLICENRGMIELQRGNRKAGLAMLERAIALQPLSAPALSAAGIAYAEEGNNARARDLLERAVALEAGDPEAAYRLGVLLFSGGERQRAFELWNRAAALGYAPAQKALAGGGGRP